mgnify:CR=1 FL=1
MNSISYSEIGQLDTEDVTEVNSSGGGGSGGGVGAFGDWVFPGILVDDADHGPGTVSCASGDEH